MNLTALCIKRPVTTVMIFSVLVLLGIFNSLKMPIDLYPEITSPTINVSTSYSGAGPEEVEQLVTIPIEQAVATVNRVTAVTSNSREGSSRVTVYFDWGVNLDERINEIRANLDRITRRLPSNAGTPSINRYDPSSAPIITLGLSGQMDEAFLRTIAEDEIAAEVQKIDGVANVDVRGGRNRRISVALKRERLAAFGLTVSQVASAIRSENVIQPAGNLETETGQFLLRTSGKLENVGDLREIVVTYRNKIPIFLRDLAAVEEELVGTENLVRIDQQPGIVMSVQKQSGSNTVAVANEVYQVVNTLQRKYPELNLRVLNDTSTFIRESVSGVANAALLGATLAGLVLLFFLQDWRSTLISGVVMPVSILATLVIAYFSKMTLNTISLGGLALGVGMLVDNTVVVIDNISRKLEHPELSSATAALDGTNEMQSALMASTLTTVCVFFPVIYLSGRTGIVFKELAYMVIFSLLCSLVVAVTLIPMLSAKYLRTNGHNQPSGRRKVNALLALQRRWENSYRNLLRWCLQHKILVVFCCLLVFGATLLLWPLIGTELVSVTDEGIISISCSLPPGTKLAETDLQAQKFEAIIAQIPEVENTEVTVRSTRASFTLRLYPRAQRQRSTNEVVEELQSKLSLPYAGASLWVSARNSMRMLYSSSDSAIVIDLRGYNQELGRQTAEIIMARLTALPGISNVGISRDDEEPEFAIDINRKRAADLGVATSRIAEAIQSSFEGQTATTIRRNGKELAVHVSLQDADKRSIQDVGRILVPGNNNRLFPLSSMVEIKLTNSPVNIQRKDRERNLAVTARLDEGADLAATMRLVQDELADIQLPPGFNLYYGGDFEEQQRSFSELRLALIMAVLLVYMVMASQFESLLDPFLIMFSLPFTVGGVLLMLVMTDTLLNNQVYIGLIILAGIAVNNAIVLISYFRLLLSRGLPLEEAVLTGAVARLRPVLMTTITTASGLTPLALGLGTGSELQAPMARTVIGGLSFSMIVTLVLIPVIFTAVNGWVDKLRSRRLRRATGFSRVLLLIVIGLTFLNPRPVWAQSVRELLTLEQSIKQALAESEDGKIILYQREAAASSYREALGDKALNVYSEAKVGTGEPPIEVGLNLEKNIPLSNLWGVNSYADLITEQNHRLSLLNLDLQEEQVILEVISAYQNELLANRRLELAAQNLRRVQVVSEELRLKSELGFTNIVEETGAEAQLAVAKTALTRAEQQLRLARFNLRRLLNLEAQRELVLAPLPEVEFEGALDALCQKAVAHRLDMKQAQIRVTQAETLLQLAKLASSLGISLNWNYTAANLTAGLVLSNQNQQRTTGEWGITGRTGLGLNSSSFALDGTNKLELVLRWNWLDGNRRQERINQAELLLKQRVEELRKLEKRIEYQVTEAYYNYLDRQNSIANSELQLTYNRTNLAALTSKYRLGLASTKEVLDAQLLLNQAETNYEEGKADLFLACIRLLSATGELTGAKLDRQP